MATILVDLSALPILPPHDGVPDYFEPVLAYRVWEVKRSVDYLVSSERPAPFRLASFGASWNPYEPEEAKHRDATCGGSPCDQRFHCYPTCGIYGYRSVELLRDALNREVTYHSFFGANTNAYIVGAVHLWGRMVEHEKGWRAQFAYPAKFFYGPHAEDLARNYGVPYEEDLSWKLERQSDESWWNLYTSLYQPNLYQPKLLTRFVGFQSTFPPGNWTPPSNPSSSLHSGTAFSLIKKPKKLKSTYDQPTFNIHKPLHWWKGKDGIYQRSVR